MIPLGDICEDALTGCHWRVQGGGQGGELGRSRVESRWCASWSGGEANSKRVYNLHVFSGIVRFGLEFHRMCASSFVQRPGAGSGIYSARTTGGPIGFRVSFGIRQQLKY